MFNRLHMGADGATGVRLSREWDIARETIADSTALKDLTHGLRTQPEDKSLMTSRQYVNIVINSVREANPDLLCGSSQRLCVG